MTDCIQPGAEIKSMHTGNKNEKVSRDCHNQKSQPSSQALSEPPHDKTTKMTVRPAKTQISMGIPRV